MQKVYVIDIDENIAQYAHHITKKGILLFQGTDPEQVLPEIKEELPQIIILNIDTSDDEDLSFLVGLVDLAAETKSSILILTQDPHSEQTQTAIEISDSEIISFPPDESSFTGALSKYMQDQEVTINSIFKIAETYENIEQFAADLLPVIADHYHLEKIALIMADDDKKQLVPLASHNISPMLIKKSKFLIKNSFVKSIRKFSKPIRTNKLFSDLRFMEVSFEEKEKLLQMEADLLVPLHFMKEFRGILVVGKKLNKAKHDSKDLADLTKIGHKICATLYELDLDEDQPAMVTSEQDDESIEKPLETVVQISDELKADIPDEPVYSIEFNEGQVFADRYIIKSKLGQGNLGVVYLVNDQELDEEVVIKIIDPLVARNEDEIEQLKKNLTLSRKASHNTISPYFDFTESGEYKYITMAYLPGKPLNMLLNEEKQLSVNKGIILIKQICEALQTIHEAEIYHGNLKPNNIIIDDKLSVKVLDLGMGRPFDVNKTNHDELVHETAEYISPEIASGDKIDHRTDIYTLGIIMYKMFTGAVPFKADTPIATALLHVDSPPMSPRKFNTYLPFTIEEIILKCLNKSPSKRFQKISEIFDALEGLDQEISEGAFDDKFVAIKQTDQIDQFFQRGEKAFNEGRYLDCISDMKMILSIVPQHTEAQEMIEKASKQLEIDPSGAMGLKLANATIDDIIEMAQQFLDEGDYPKCLEAIRNALKKEPANKKAANIADIAQRKQLEDEIKRKKEDEKQKQKEIKQLLKDGKKAFRSGDYKECLTLMERLLELDSLHSGAQKLAQKAQKKLG